MKYKLWGSLLFLCAIALSLAARRKKQRARVS